MNNRHKRELSAVDFAADCHPYYKYIVSIKIRSFQERGIFQNWLASKFGNWLQQMLKAEI